MFRNYKQSLGLPCDSDGKDPPEVQKTDCLQCRRHWFNPWVRRSPGEGMATLSSILVCRIPLTEEPGRLGSIGSQESDTSEQLTHI